MQKELLASLKIVNETTCYLYPQYEYSEDGRFIQQITDKKREFPDRGTIYLPKNSDENLNRYLYKLLKVSFDTENIASNYNEYDMYSQKCKYYLKTSDIEELSRNELVEIITIEKSLDDILTDKGNRLIKLPFLPLNKKVLVKIDTWCYGPFNFTIEQTEPDCIIKIIPDDYEIYKYDYEELKKYIFGAQVTSSFDDPQKYFIRDLEVLENEVHIVDRIEFVDNEVLIQECINIVTESAELSDIKENGITTLKNLKTILEKFPDLRKSHALLTDKNIQRISELLNNVDELEKYKNTIIEDYYNSGNITEEEKTLYLEKHPEVIKNVVEQSTQYKEQIDDLVNERTNLETEILRLEEKKESATLELNRVKEDSDHYTQSVLKSIQDEIENLKRQREELRNKNKYLEEQTELAESQKKELLKTINELNIDIKNKVLKWLESKRDDDIIGLLVSEFGNYKSSTASKNIPNYNIVSYESADEIIYRISTFFTRSKREIKRNDIVNYLTLLASNFMTVFGGKPGTGKTSTCNILAKAFGVERDRYADISVGRGWVSARDLIGYYNPLTHCIEKTQPKFSECLEIMNLEAETELSDAIYLVLLDEANLSQIEHYWSEFNKISDDYAGKIIELSETIKYTIVEELRFIATINYDHTTEILSPRFLDRAWIVTIDEVNSLDLLGDSADMQEVPNADDMISYNSLISLFTVNGSSFKNKQMSPFAKEILNSIIERFRNIGHIVSPRSLIAIRNYCIVAEKYMEGEKQNAVDYALAQKLLPQIDGNGKNYLDFLEDIASICQEYQLTKSQKIISNIIENGKREHNYFNYFNM